MELCHNSTVVSVVNLVQPTTIAVYHSERPQRSLWRDASAAAAAQTRYYCPPGSAKFTAQSNGRMSGVLLLSVKCLPGFAVIISLWIAFEPDCCD